MFKNLTTKLKESFFSILPIFLIVCVLSLTLIKIDSSLFVKFIICTLLLIVGMSLFNLGSEMSMIKMGESIGSTLTKKKKLSLMLISAFVIGFIVTFAEPDLAILASQTPINKWIFVACVSIGVAVFLLLGVLKIIFNLNLNIILAITYGLIFLIAIIFPNKFIQIAFDSGSVTTGPLSAPLILAFGLGICSVLGGKNNKADSFGLIALGSAGPILATILLSVFLKGDINLAESTPLVSTWQNLLPTILTNLLNYLKDIFFIILPIAIIFFIFQFSMIKLPKLAVGKILIGLFYTYIGISIFLTGIQSAYLPIASEIGKQIVENNQTWILLPLSLILGYFMIAAEPAVQVLKKQVEEITEGAIKQKTILITMSIGVALSVFLAMAKTLFNIPYLAIIIPVYALTIIFSFFNTKILSAVAYDAGGTSTGAMAVSFVLPLVTGVSIALGQNPLLSAFGTLSLVAISPVLSLQILGFIHRMLEKRVNRKEIKSSKSQIEIIEFDYEEDN